MDYPATGQMDQFSNLANMAQNPISTAVGAATDNLGLGAAGVAGLIGLASGAQFAPNFSFKVIFCSYLIFSP